MQLEVNKSYITSDGRKVFIAGIVQNEKGNSTEAFATGFIADTPMPKLWRLDGRCVQGLGYMDLVEDWKELRSREEMVYLKETLNSDGGMDTFISYYPGGEGKVIAKKIIKLTEGEGME